MGAAFSSSANRFSLRRVAPALILLVLLFVAGAAATLHRKDTASVQYSGGPVHGQRTRPPPPRKVLRHRRAEAVVELATNNSGCEEGKQCPQQLPRGLVHDTTNLEMEPSLAGDPEHGGAATPNKAGKSLLAVPVGIKNKPVVDKLVSKFLAAGAEDFAVMLFHYDGAVEQWGDVAWSGRAVHVAARGQTKWWFAKRFLHPDVVAAYDYVFLWDEDIEVDAFDPARYLAAVRREGLDVSQPALDRRSEIHHAITARALLPAPDGVHRRVRNTRCGEGSTAGPPCAGWVEMMVPVFSREAWRCAWRMVQNDLIHGWGLDYRLGYCARGDRACSVGVVDSEYVLHRGVPMLGGGGKQAAPSAGRAAVRRRSFKEMQIFNRRWEEAAAEDKSWTDPYAAQPTTATSR